jgi:hypothetical protein
MFALDTTAANASWTGLPCPSVARSDHCVVSVGSKVYIAGGYDETYSQVCLRHMNTHG